MSELEPTKHDPNNIQSQFSQLGLRLQVLLSELSHLADTVDNTELANRLLNHRDAIQEHLEENL